MDSYEITSEILNGCGKALDLGYNRLYVNVDELENGFGFLRLLAMKGPKYIIVYEGTFELGVCYQVLELIERSKYDITNFTIEWSDD